MTNNFKVGDLVWAKMKGFPIWPGFIENSKEAKSKKQFYVHFYGSDNCAWILDKNIEVHSDEQVKRAREKKMTSVFNNAVDEIIKQSMSEDKPEQEVLGNLETQKSELPVEVLPTNSKSVTSKPKAPKRKLSIDKIKPKKKKSLKREIEEPVADAKLPKQEDPFSELFANISSNLSTNTRVAVIKPFDDTAISNTLAGHIAKRDYFNLKPIEPLKIETLSESMIDKKKSIKPTTLKIGFLGLGNMGQRIVKNLILTGHDVTIWNRSDFKCEPFGAIGADIAKTPADVVESADIIFSCVSGSNAVDKLVMGNCGVISGLEASYGETKGYVEMTTIDSNTSDKIATAIMQKGCRYLEAPICGSRTLAEDGQLSIIAAGNKGLFTDCTSCFNAMSKTTYYLGDEIGSATKMNLITNTILGVSYAALAEALVLVERLGLNTEGFMEVLRMSPANSELLLQKGNAMCAREFQTDSSLKDLQEDLRMTLSLADSVKQPMLVTSAANNVYKHAELLRYSEHDVSAVYCGAKY